MSDRAYEEMSDQELDHVAEQALREHESGGPRFKHREARVEGTVPISLRVPAALLANIKAVAEARGMPYQRLMKAWLEEGLTHSAPDSGAKPVTLRLTQDQAAQLRESGSLDIHLEAS